MIPQNIQGLDLTPINVNRIQLITSFYLFSEVIQLPKSLCPTFLSSLYTHIYVITQQ